jgi:threonine/homoserine/homoserine lactone efflux protein
MAFLEGYALGLALVVLIGPVLFVLLGVTLENGRASGLAVAAGIFTSDILVVLISALGFAGILVDPVLTPWIGVLGGGLLVSLGVRYLVTPPGAAGFPSSSTAQGLLGAFVKGFLVNFVNPFVFAVWLGIIAFAGARYGIGTGLALFLTGSVLAVLTLDTLKVLLASRIKRLLGPKNLMWAFWGSGSLMCLFGVRLVLTGVL